MPDSVELLEQKLVDAADASERIELLNSIAFNLYRTDPTKALASAEHALELSRQSRDNRGEANSLRWIAASLESLSDYKSAMDFATRSHALFAKIGDDLGSANALNAIGIIARSTADYAAALTAFKQALTIFLELGDNTRAAAAYNNIGTAHSSIGNFSESLDAYLAALSIYEQENEELNVGIAESNIAIIYYYLHDVDKAYDYHNRGLAIFERLGIEYRSAITLGNLSDIQKVRGEYQAASDGLKRALAIFESIGERRYQATTRVKLGLMFMHLHDLPQAMEQMQIAAEIAEQIGSADTYCDAQHQIGKIYIEDSQHALAIEALQKGLLVTQTQNMLKDEMDMHETLSAVYESAGDIVAAIKHLRKYAELQISLFGAERQRAVAEMQARFDVEHAEREREVFRLKSEHLEEMMVQRSKELTTLAMHLVQKNAALQNVRKHAMDISAEHPSAKAAFKELLATISETLHDDNDWDRFETEFQHVHHDFIKILSQTYPRLTPTELKVCALLKVNLSNKAITKMLSVSLRNIESHRYSIRKKMDLPSDVNLQSYLAAL